MKNTFTASQVLVLLVLFNVPIHAQQNVPKFQLGLGVGTLVYQGDLTPNSIGSYRTIRPAINLFAGKIFSPSIAARVNLHLGRLIGDESRYDNPEYRQERNFYFTSRVTEVSVIGEWNVLGRNYRSRGFAPYVFGGAGYSFLTIHRDWSRLNASHFNLESNVLTGLPEDQQHRVPSGLLVFPVGAGLRYYFNDRIGVSAESAYRISSTDYLDGFSQSVNPKEKDHYYSHTVGVVYRIGKKNLLDCPVVRY